VPAPWPEPLPAPLPDALPDDAAPDGLVAVAYVRLPVWQPDTVVTFLNSVLPAWRDRSTWATPDAAEAIESGPPVVALWHPNPATGRAPSVHTDADGGAVLGLGLDGARIAPGELVHHAEKTLGHLMRLARVPEGYATRAGAPPADGAAWRRAVRAPDNLLSTA
jgi:hypothetical protein